MALGFYFAPAAMTTEQYSETLRRLKKAGAYHPAGRTYHACFGTPDKLAVFDVWTSQAAFDAFGATLLPILQSLGVDPGQPAVMPVHNTLVPPAAKPRPAVKAKKAAPKKRASKKANKSTARRAKKR